MRMRARRSVYSMLCFEKERREKEGLAERMDRDAKEKGEGNERTRDLGGRGGGERKAGF